MKKKKRRTSNQQLATRDFLLEIGCEELPADYLPAVLNLDSAFLESKGLWAAASAVFSEHQVIWKNLRLYGTPRRLVLHVEEVQPMVDQEVEGPPVQVAFDASGKPTPAARGFAKKMKVAVSSLKKKQTARGERLVLQKSVQVERVLAEAVPQIIRAIYFPKTMRWDRSGVRFARPIRWLLALYGSKKISCVFGSVKSGTTTFDSRRRAKKSASVKSSKAYFSTLRRWNIRLEEGWGVQRGPGQTTAPLKPRFSKRAALLKALRSKAKQAGGRLADENSEEFQWLLSNVTFLAEEPVVQVGSFRKEYLSLPSEVLATSMAKHLKLFGVFEKEGKNLHPKFLAVLEGKPKVPAVVMANIERILEARFADAQFFYREDTRSGLEAKVPELATVVFHEKLGTVKDRIGRLERLTEKVAEQLRLPNGDLENAKRVARLAKVDLVTQLVREFPSLQGIIGGHYAREGGEPEKVASAIAQHYLPRTANDPLPQSVPSALVSLADRLDTLLGYFGVGLKPTGSLDPYALRRQALGVVRILTEGAGGISFIGLSIDRLFDEGIKSWGSQLSETKVLKAELRAFLRERFEWLAKSRSDIVLPNEFIGAIWAAGDDDLADAWERLKILRTLWTHPWKRSSFLKAAKVAERTARIVQADKGNPIEGKVNPDLLKERSEKELWSAWKVVQPKVQAQIQSRRYEEAAFSYGSLYSHIHTFFDTVMVMDEDPKLRKNRLAFMNEIHQALAKRFADLSKLSLPKVEV